MAESYNLPFSVLAVGSGNSGYNFVYGLGCTLTLGLSQLCK